MEDKNKRYDEIVAKIMENVLNEREIGKKIVLWDFHEDSHMDRLYFNVAAMVSDMVNEPLYIQMPFFTYLKMKWKRRKTRKNLKYVFRKSSINKEAQTSVYLIVDFVRQYFGETEEFMKQINDEYYGWV